jgi:DNA recombination protein RmuC
MLNFIFVLLILLCGLAGYLLWRFQSQSPEAIMLKALEEKTPRNDCRFKR